MYADGFSGKTNVSFDEIASFFAVAQKFLEHTIDANEEGGLYNAYNLLRLTDGGLEIAPMFPMLEGQTAALGSGRLGAGEARRLVEAMEGSGLYSREHKSFYLYPIKNLPTFMDKNVIPEERVRTSRLLQALLARDGEGVGQGLVLRDARGRARFHEKICTARDLEAELGRAARNQSLAALVEAERSLILDIFDEVFRHSSFTGRSGVMYKYEGIGCIYWHQNSKFLLSLQEAARAAGDGVGAGAGAGAEAAEADQSERAALKESYYRVRDGLGFTKGPAQWGAFPLEPYSHSPYMQPAQQPGMTGQVKEDIITRRLELGLEVRGGSITFAYDLLRREEFLSEPTDFDYFAIGGERSVIQLRKGMLAYTLCQVPIVLELSEEEAIHLSYADGREKTVRGLALGAEDSASVFRRDGAISKLSVRLREYAVCGVSE